MYKLAKYSSIAAFSANIVAYVLVGRPSSLIAAALFGFSAYLWDKIDNERK